jgi:predicted membrane protein
MKKIFIIFAMMFLAITITACSSTKSTVQGICNNTIDYVADVENTFPLWQKNTINSSIAGDKINFDGINLMAFKGDGSTYLTDIVGKLSENAFSFSRALKNIEDAELLNEIVAQWNKNATDYINFCNSYK